MVGGSILVTVFIFLYSQLYLNLCVFFFFFFFFFFLVLLFFLSFFIYITALWKLFCCFNTHHAMGRFSSRQVIWYLFFAQKIEFNRVDSLYEMLQRRILFSGKNKDNISKYCLQECLPSMLSVNTKNVFNACNGLLLHSKSEGQAQPVHPHSLI